MMCRSPPHPSEQLEERPSALTDHSPCTGIGGTGAGTFQGLQSWNGWLQHTTLRAKELLQPWQEQPPSRPPPHYRTFNLQKAELVAHACPPCPIRTRGTQSSMLCCHTSLPLHQCVGCHTSLPLVITASISMASPVRSACCTDHIDTHIDHSKAHRTALTKPTHCHPQGVPGNGSRPP
jgi:hypothetical protein